MHVITCRPVIVGGFPQEQEAIAVELGGQPCEALQRLTFLLSKASPDTCSTHRNANVVPCFTFQCIC
jgi:hypothetical protein